MTGLSNIQIRENLGHFPTKWNFTIDEREGRFFIYRNGSAIGAIIGYDTRKNAKQAIRETIRWDNAIGG